MDSFPNPSKLTGLPVELLEIIISFIPEKAYLKSLSRVCRLFRQLCGPLLFQSLQVGFSISRLDRLLQVSKSSFAPYVKSIRYEAFALVDPLAAHWDTFHACLYTATEFARDRMDLYGVRKNWELSYPSVFSYFRLRCEEQQEILRTDLDTRTLVGSLPCFPNLHTVQLCFVDGIEDRFQSLANRMLLDGHPLFPNHLEKLLTAIIVAQENGVSIRTFEIRGFYSRAVAKDRFLQQLAAEALSRVEELRLVDSPAMLAFINHVHFPCLRRAELANCWLSVPALEGFIRLRAGSLQHLHLENTWALEEEMNNEEFHVSMVCTKSILDHLACIPGAGCLTLTMNRQRSGGYEAQKTGKDLEF